MKKSTIIIVAYNQKNELKQCVELLEKNGEELHMILVDNGSNDGTGDWLHSLPYDKVLFDEGRMPYGTVLNTVLENFPLEEAVFFLLPQYQIGKHTLERMNRTLWAEDKVGMVGCRCNTFACEQYVSLDGLEELYRIEAEELEARDYDVVGCRDGCIGVRRAVLQEVGLFEGDLAQSNNVMEDYQLKVIKKGYQNCLSRNAYVYCEQEEQKNILNDLLNYCDGGIQKANWGMNYFNIQANTKFVPMIKKEKMANFSVLEIGCDMGANLLGVRNAFPNCRIYGLELNENAVEIGKHLLPLVQGNIEEKQIPFEGKFDYILFGDVLEHLRNPEDVLTYCKSILKEDGCVVASVPNLMHISVMKQLLNGRFCYEDTGLLDRTHIHFFTYKELVEMFERVGYTVEEVQSCLNNELMQADVELITKLMEISTEVERFMYETYQYNIIARR